MHRLHRFIIGDLWTEKFNSRARFYRSVEQRVTRLTDMCIYMCVAIRDEACKPHAEIHHSCRSAAVNRIN